MNPRFRNLAVIVLLMAGALLVIGSGSKSAKIPKVICSAAPGTYPATPYGKWIALVRNNKGVVADYGVVVVYEEGGKIRLVGKNYRPNGSLKYTWRGTGTWNGTTLLYVWKITGANVGVNKMVLTSGNAQLTGYWFRKGAKGRESFCRAAN